MSENEPDMSQCGNPHGEEGIQVLYDMIEGHRKFIEWSMECIKCPCPRNVLDIGYGSGIFVRYVLKKYPKTMGYGIDISETSYECAMKYDRYFVDEGRLKLIVGDVHDMPYEDGKFDLIVSNGSHNFWDDIEGAFKEIARVLHKGGIFCLTSASEPVTEEKVEELRTKWGSSTKIYTDAQMKELFEKAGLDASLHIKLESEVGVFIAVKKRF